jgi:hypothetical protein
VVGVAEPPGELPHVLEPLRVGHYFLVVFTWTADELKRFAGVVGGQSKLHFYLMLYCVFLGKIVCEVKSATPFIPPPPACRGGG